MIFIDSHVHFHACYRMADWLDHAYHNFNKILLSTKREIDPIYILILTESANENYFEILYRSTTENTPNAETIDLAGWHISRTEEEGSLIIKNHKKKIVVIAGHQIAAAENLEVLALGSTQKIPDNLPIFTILETVKSLGGLRVIPWGAGKWLYSRGRLLKDIIDSMAEENDFFLGDESGRPFFWPMPEHFTYANRYGIKNLPGTDPLPFPSEVGQVGSYGTFIDASINLRKPKESLFQLLTARETKLNYFGKNEGFFRFLNNQFRMQIRKKANL